MGIIITTKGMVDEGILNRTVGFEDRPGEFVVWVEWRLKADGWFRTADGDVTGTIGELVKRNAHVILKDGVAVESAAGTFG